MFRIALINPKFWHISTLVPQVWTPSVNRKPLGKLEPEIIATWLCDMVSLTSQVILPLCIQKTDAKTNPHAYYTTYTLAATSVVLVTHFQPLEEILSGLQPVYLAVLPSNPRIVQRCANLEPPMALPT